MNQEFSKNLFNSLCQEANLVGSTALVISNNQVIEEYAYGVRDKELQKDVTLDTIFRIASISKLVVATTLMTFVEEGKIDITEDISKYLGFKVRNPKFIDVPITLSMILTQTSSICDGLEGGETENGYNKYNTVSLDIKLEDLLKTDGKYFAKETFSSYKPGTHFCYSNFGCGILACIIERVSGEYFFDVVKKRVLSKLGLNASFMASDLDYHNIASTYNQDGTLCRSAESFVSNSIVKHSLGNNFVGPAGGLFISIRDLSVIMQVFMNDGKYNNIQILKKETMDRMLEISNYFEPTTGYYAKGLQFKIIDDYKGVRLFGHFGSAYGVKSSFFFNPSQKIGFIFFTNGGAFKEISGFGSDVQKELMESVLCKYWDYSKTYTFCFKKGEDFGTLDGRRINITYVPAVRRTLSKRPYLTTLSYINALSLPTNIGRRQLDKETKGLHLSEALMYVSNDYFYKTYMPCNEEYIITYKALKNPTKVLESNYHTHCNYCDHATGSVRDYIMQAKKIGFKRFGMSGHAPLPNSFMGKGEGYNKGHMPLSEFPNYLAECNAAKEIVKKDMQVFNGLEIEYIEGHDEYYKMLKDQLDYLILGQHFMYHTKYLDTYFDLNYENLHEYGDAVCHAMDTGYFKIFAHPDLFMYSYMSKRGIKREFDSECEKVTRQICDKASKTGTVLEINAAGLGRGELLNEDGSIQPTYTTKKFFEIAKEYDVKFIIGLDAHSIYGLYCNSLELAYRFCEELSIDVINEDTIDF